jgi:hypothetical protein
MAKMAPANAVVGRTFAGGRMPARLIDWLSLAALAASARQSMSRVLVRTATGDRLSALVALFRASGAVPASRETRVG